MKPFELIEHTADVGIKAWGSTLTELFENAAKGLFFVITGEGYKPQGSEIEKKIEINEDKDSLEGVLVSWLSELLYIFNREKIFAGYLIRRGNENINSCRSTR